jgi:hypothetical protein
MQDGSAIPAKPTGEGEQQAWREFWELIGDAAYQLWRDERLGGDLQETA